MAPIRNTKTTTAKLAMTDEFLDRAPHDLAVAVNSIADAAKHAAEITDLALIDKAIVQARADLADILRDLENELGRRMGTKRVTVEGVGVLERHPRKSYTQWDREALLADVLDSKLVNAETGELVDESPLEKVLQVWNLSSPRRTVLVARGLTPDEYCNVEDQGGFTVQIR